MIVENLLSAPILCFALGVVAALVRSDLEIPQPIAKFLSLYLLFAIGIHGGHALHESGIGISVLLALGAAVCLATIVPIHTFFLLRLKLDPYNAAAIAATYGSISAVTFVTATAFLQSQGIAYGGHMIAAMALMESPAILVGVLLLRWAVSDRTHGAIRLGAVAREAAVNGAVVLIVGALVIGFASGDRGWHDLAPFADGIFRGMLCFFLLDMGILAARRVRDLRAAGAWLPAFAIGAPLVNAALALAMASILRLSVGDAVLLLTLAASASYIAVPAAMRLTVPEANPSLYVSLALGVTFPFNILIGLPLYVLIVRTLWHG